MNKKELKEFLRSKSCNKVIIRNNKYSINGSSLFSINELVHFITTKYNIIFSITDLEDILNEFSKLVITEKNIQNRLAAELRGKTEIVVENIGRLDILTNDEIIEVKEFSKWKHAIGQILSYATKYPLHKPRIHLYGEMNKDAYEVYKICKEKNIKLTYESC